eukprot:evm.model.scf_2336.1 EVM.evm.TU.scf_2336.1   scf_2336:1322-8896(+)
MVLDWTLWAKVIAANVSIWLIAWQLPAARRARRDRNEKPQTKFRTPVDNSDRPFRHLEVSEHGTYWSPDGPLHPYYQLVQGIKDQASEQTEGGQKWHPEMPPCLSETPCVWVDSKAALKSLAAELQSCTRFAIDTEHHAHRSYLGITCLIQISTGPCIHLVDALRLHDDLGILRGVFADPKICKVVHGGHNDSLWLQRDFHIYLVNVFDTEKACQVLGKKKRNLAHLLETYCGMSSDKSLQLADWRQRPLTPELETYAKMDVHYLLFLSDILIQELLKQDAEARKGLKVSGDAPPSCYASAIVKSCNMTLSMYTKVSNRGAASAAAAMLIRKAKIQQGIRQHEDKLTGNQGAAGHGEGTRVCGTWRGDAIDEEGQMNLIFHLCLWRDKAARDEDESVEYILPGPILLEIARTCPPTPADLISTAKAYCICQESGTGCGKTGPLHWQPCHRFVNDAARICQLFKEAAANDLEWEEGPFHLGVGNAAPRNKKQRSQGETDSARQRMVEVFCAKRQVYSNCIMLAMDDELLCYSDRRRLEWYVSKGLADKVADEPYTIKLRFQHSTADDENFGAHQFYVRGRLNRCVVCGEDNHYLRYRIVPTCYRKHFPDAHKSHRSHDIVLLCVDCHHKAQIVTDKVKKMIASEYGIPLNAPRMLPGSSAQCSGCAGQVTEGHNASARRVRAAALALLKYKTSLPVERTRELEAVVHTHLGRSPEGQTGLHPGDLDLALKSSMSKKELGKLHKKEGIRLHEETSAYESSAGGTTTENGRSGQEAYDRMEETTPPIMDPPPTVEPSGGVEVGHLWHGKQVVDMALSRNGEDGINELVRRFRESFVEALKPKYLPEFWSTVHYAPREFGKHSIYAGSGTVQDRNAAPNQPGRPRI